MQKTNVVSQSSRLISIHVARNESDLCPKFGTEKE